MIAVGLMLEGQYGLTWERWDRILRAAAAFGFDGVFRSDHYTIGPPDYDSLETWVSLTYAASHSTRIEFGPLVSPTTFRHPALTARMAAAVDDLSGGRLVLGLGTGWHEREHKQYGIPFYDVKTRFEMLQDALEITTRLFDHSEPVSYTGKHFSLDGAVLLPRPKRRTPILIGGNGMNKTLPFVAQYADEWNGVFLSPADYRERMTRLDELLDQGGRPRSAVKRSLMTQVVFGADDAEVQTKRAQITDERAAKLVIGTASQIVDRLGEYAEAGVERIMLQWLDLDDLTGIERLARDVVSVISRK